MSERSNEGFPGYRYQQKCALLFLLQNFTRPNFHCVDMEDEKGDDVGLHFADRSFYYQCKRYKSLSTIKPHIKKFFSRYFDVILKEMEDRTKPHDLVFVYSKRHTNADFQAIEYPHSPASKKQIRDLFKRLMSDESDPDKETIGLRADKWEGFTSILSLDVRIEQDIEEDIINEIRKLCVDYIFSLQQRLNILNHFMEHASEAMATKSKCTSKVVNGILLEHLGELGLPYHICYAEEEIERQKRKLAMREAEVEAWKRNKDSKLSAISTGEE